MAEGKASRDWDHTASLIANFRNALGDKSAAAEQFHPDHYKAFYRRQLRQHTRGKSNAD